MSRPSRPFQLRTIRGEARKFVWSCKNRKHGETESAETRRRTDHDRFPGTQISIARTPFVRLSHPPELITIRRTKTRNLVRRSNARRIYYGRYDKNGVSLSYEHRRERASYYPAAIRVWHRFPNFAEGRNEPRRDLMKEFLQLYQSSREYARTVTTSRIIRRYGGNSFRYGYTHDSRFAAGITRNMSLGR